METRKKAISCKLFQNLTCENRLEKNPDSGQKLKIAGRPTRIAAGGHKFEIECELIMNSKAMPQSTRRPSR
jgi:hypothetical protein